MTMMTTTNDSDDGMVILCDDKVDHGGDDDWPKTGSEAAWGGMRQRITKLAHQPHERQQPRHAVWLATWRFRTCVRWLVWSLSFLFRWLVRLVALPRTYVGNVACILLPLRSQLFVCGAARRKA